MSKNLSHKYYLLYIIVPLLLSSTILFFLLYVPMHFFNPAHHGPVKPWSRTLNGNSPLISAEWIREAPYNGGLLLLSDLQITTVDRGTVNTTNPGLQPYYAIIIQDTNGQESNPFSDTGSLNVCWISGTTFTPCIPPSGL